MNKGVAIRFAVGLFALALLFLGYQWYKGIEKDPLGGLSSTTAGMLAAVEYGSEGARAVIFKSDGTKMECPDHSVGANDKDLAWLPNGNRLFFVSDRKESTYNVYRWDPQRGNVDRRSSGTRSQGNIQFGPSGYPQSGESALLTAGGIVNEYFPLDGRIIQILPPVQEGAGDRNEEETGTGQFQGVYGRIGSSFKLAKWGKDRDWIIAVVRREGGEVLIAQSLALQATKLMDGTTANMMPPPMVIDAGDKIDFDVAPDGKVVYSVLGLQFPDPANVPKEFIKNNKAIPPFRNSLMFFDPATFKESGITPILIVNKDDTAVVQPVISPDGAQVAVVAGSREQDGNFTPKNLVLLPIVKDAVAQQLGGPIAKGAIRECSWHPNGKSLIYARSEGDRRKLFEVDLNSGQEKALTTDSGNYGSPVYSPQTK